MEHITIPVAWAWLLSAVSALLLLANFAEKIGAGIRHAKAPNLEQDKRLAELETWRKEIDATLKRDSDHLESLDCGNRVTQRALLALLDHGIDGNNIEQMQHAKEELQSHLINR